jgi:hypothetical protein
MGITAGIVKYGLKPPAKLLHIGFQATLYTGKKVFSGGTSVTRGVASNVGYRIKEDGRMAAEEAGSDMEKVVLPETKNAIVAVYTDLKRTWNDGVDYTSEMLHKTSFPLYVLFPVPKLYNELTEGDDNLVIGNCLTRLHGYAKETVVNRTEASLQKIARRHANAEHSLYKNCENVRNDGKKIKRAFGKTFDDVPEHVLGRIHHNVPALIERLSRDNNVTVARYEDYVDSRKRHVERSPSAVNGEFRAVKRVLNRKGRGIVTDVITKQFENDLYKQDGLIPTHLDLIEKRAQREPLRNKSKYLEARMKKELQPLVNAVEEAIRNYRNTARTVAVALIDTHSTDPEFAESIYGENAIDGEFREVNPESSE